MSERVGILCVHAPYPTLNELAEVLNLRHRAFAHLHRKQYRFLDYLPQAHAVCLCCLDNLADGGVADASGRIIDDALESLLIVRIGNQPEIGNYILDLLTLIEAQSAIDTIRDIVLPQLFLKTTALRVRAIQDGKVAPITMILPTQPLDILRYDHRFLAVRVGRLQLKPLTVFIL